MQVLRLLTAFLACIWVFSASAHQPGLSTLVVQLRTNSLHAELIVAWRDIEEVTPLDSNQDGDFSADEFAAVQTRLRALGDAAVEFEADGAVLKRSAATVQREDATGIRFLSDWEMPIAPKVLLVRSGIVSEMPRGHHQVTSVRGITNSLLAEYAMTRDRNLLEVPLEEGAPVQDHSVGQFIWLGVEHILIGWDHLTFLFGLLIVGGTLREAVKIITSFTIAHSLTLALATFNLVELPSDLVETIIAASIVYVAVENLVRHNYRWRPALTFGFGLIHGLGFATVLRDLGIVNSSGVVKPLLCFNIGVELGQVAIAAAVLPWIWKLNRRFGRRWVISASVVVALLGTWFLLERTVLK